MESHSPAAGYQLVKLASGAHSVRSLAHGETFHPVIGPAAEAEALYVRQLHALDRLKQCADEFVIWDVGLGSAANPLTFLRLSNGCAGRVRIVSFDHTLEPLRFATAHEEELQYVRGFREPLTRLAENKSARFTHGEVEVTWQVHVADFPALIASPEAQNWPKPHIIMFDAFSPARNPAMWTAPLFARLHQLLDPARPCSLATYSRSTLLRVTLLLAGFYVGVGHASGEKDETTIAANDLSLIEEPLGADWLARAKRSTSAEPLWTAEYKQAPLSGLSWERLQEHPQFKRA
ncbi:MAG TPA: MnmC family methyltransferase [Methylomirabilota bacterium]|nr:MnmC family methyltransferase [Methylomirabilota bacterium]